MQAGDGDAAHEVALEQQSGLYLSNDKQSITHKKSERKLFRASILSIRAGLWYHTFSLMKGRAFMENFRRREEVMAWAQGLWRRGFYVLDTETTGLGSDAEIVQIGIVNQDGAEMMNELVKPTVRIPSAASRVHGIYDHHVAGAHSFWDVYTALSKLLAGQVVVAYNMDFDWRMMQQSGAKYRLPSIRVRETHCAMKQYARYRGTPSNRRGGYRWHKLGNAVYMEGLEVVDAHDALGDARMTLALIRSMADF